MKKIRLFRDFYTFLFGSIYMLILESCSLIFFITNETTVIGILVMVAIAVSYGFCLPRCASVVELNKNGLVLYTPFKKATTKTYIDCCYFQILQNHNFGKCKYFIVISEQFYSIDEITKANNIQSLETAIKIKITKKRYQILSSILPESKRKKLQQVLTEDGGVPSAANRG